MPMERPLPPRAHGDRRAAARARRLRQALRRRAADLDPRAALPAAAGLRLGRDPRRRRARRRPTRSSTCCSGATSSRHTGAEPQSILTMPILPGIDGERKMSKSLGNYVGVDRAARGDVRQADARPRRDDAGLLRAAARRAARSRDPPRDAKRALARALTARLHGEEAAAAAEAHFERLFVERGVPDDVEEHAFAPANGERPPAGAARRRFGISRSEGRRLLAQAGVQGSTGSRWPGDRLDVPAAELDGVVLQVGKRRFKRVCAARLELYGGRAASVADPLSAGSRSVRRARSRRAHPRSAATLAGRALRRVESPPRRGARSLKTQQYVRST